MKYHADFLNKNCKPLHNDNAKTGLKIIIATAFGEFEEAEIQSIIVLKNGNKQIKYAIFDKSHIYTCSLSSLEYIESRLKRANEKPSIFIAE